MFTLKWSDADLKNSQHLYKVSSWVLLVGPPAKSLSCLDAFIQHYVLEIPGDSSMFLQEPDIHYFFIAV